MLRWSLHANKLLQNIPLVIILLKQRITNIFAVPGLIHVGRIHFFHRAQSRSTLFPTTYEALERIIYRSTASYRHFLSMQVASEKAVGLLQSSTIQAKYGASTSTHLSTFKKSESARSPNYSYPWFYPGWNLVAMA